MHFIACSSVKVEGGGRHVEEKSNQVVIDNDASCT
jgi:hypothetical protein